MNSRNGEVRDAMLGKNRSAGTLRAYRTDVLQFIAFLHENNVAIAGVGDVGKVDVLEYLAALARKGLSGVARARKVSALREYFRFLEGLGTIERSPAAGIDMSFVRNLFAFDRIHVAEILRCDLFATC